MKSKTKQILLLITFSVSYILFFISIKFNSYLSLLFGCILTAIGGYSISYVTSKEDEKMR